ncbi:MAG: cytidylate kinase-like family protein [Bacteroidota bacterium]|nr:cytidylate kinase-like family protein [Bacteroidota bacterium]
MKQNKTFVITISRQLGSGGAYIGQQLAKRLNVFYADREIINKVAQQYSVLEEDVEPHDEKILSFWESLFQFNSFSSDVYTPPKLFVPKERDLFQAEAEIIEHIALEGPAVIIGRCGAYVLRDYPNLISLFLHGDLASRMDRIQKLYKLSGPEAEKMIAKSDKERAYHCKSITGKVWGDAGNYNLSIDTGKIGLDECVELILNYLDLIHVRD